MRPPMLRLRLVALAGALIGSFPALPASAAQATNAAVEAMPTPANAAAAAVQGFIYGRVESRSGTYTGRLRWDDEEAFWDDHLNGDRNQRPYLDLVPPDRRGARHPVKLFGLTLGSRWQAWSEDRSIAVRFGDITRLERHGRRHVLLMKSGLEVELKGGSNDLRGEITVWDAEHGETELEIEAIDSITFLPTPASLAVDVQRAYGTVLTTAGSFEGFIIWDNEERLSTDILDGDDPSGKRHKIPLGDIRRIARRSQSSCELTLTDGSVLVLDGTNDVDGSNRGIYVDDPRFGRIEVPWRAFDRLDLASGHGSGPAYGSYTAGRPLRGTVETLAGARLAGGIVYDVDESETWDILSGWQDDIGYEIPFSLITAITRLDEDSSRVTLSSGTSLTLGKSADVGGEHAGIVVLGPGAPRYVPWAEVRSVSFE